MLKIHDGQCGTCAYFGAEHSNEPRLVQIRRSHEAEPDVVEPCGQPDNQQHDLKVSPVSGCAEFKLAKVA